MFDELFEPDVYVGQPRGYKFAVDDDAWRRPAFLTPGIAVFVGGVVVVFVIPLPEVDHGGWQGLGVLVTVRCDAGPGSETPGSALSGPGR